MHIPDGYLSPQTCAVVTGAMVPVWGVAARRVERVVTRRNVPLLALSAAFSFVAMMFNVPVPDGTSAHAVGAALVAIILGPWAAVIAVSAALAVQALFFGDGGVLAFAANALNLAVVMPVTAHAVYRVLTRRLPAGSPRRALAGAVAGYVAVNAAALATAVELGIQPVLFRAADGSPLYAPFPLALAVGSMAFAHLTVAGVAEAALTGGVIAYLLRANPDVLRINPAVAPVDAREAACGRRSPWRWAAAGLAVLALATPVGLLAEGTAFGEDSPDELDLGRWGLDAVPEGLERYSTFWSRSPLADYALGPDQNATVGYLVSAFAGVALLAGATAGAWVLVSRLRAAASPPGADDGRADPPGEPDREERSA